MSLQNPAGLLWLIPLAGAIVLLYLLKMRRRELRVPATFLWPERVEEIRANSLFQRLRFSWLLVLQLLALSLIVLCVARPQSRQEGLTGKLTVLVLDNSASMGATDVKPTRFDEAVRLAGEAIQSAEPGDRIALIEAGPVPKVVFPLGGDRPRQMTALKELEQADVENDVGEALRLAASLVGSQEGARIVLLSDGAFGPIRNFSRGNASFVYKSIGEIDDNLSISALGTAETPSGRQLFCGVRNWCQKPYKGVLSLYADGKAIGTERIEIGPGAQYGHTIQAPAGASVFEARLEAPDALKSDNYAVSVATPGASLRVLLVSPGNFFLERALALDSRVTLDRAATVPSDTADRYDIVVFDGVPEAKVSARGILTLGSAGASSPVTRSGKTKAPAIRQSSPHKLLEGVDLRGVFVEEGEKVQPKAGGQVLVETDQGPLLVVQEAAAQRKAYLAFSPLQSDFPLQVGFPIFVSNALDYLGGSAVGKDVAVRPGVAFSVMTGATATLEDPSGRRLKLNPRDETLVVREVRTVGKHVLESERGRQTIYASLRSDRESQIAPVETLALGGGEVKAVQVPARFADFWRPLALLALLVLVGEWMFFARRS